MNNKGLLIVFSGPSGVGKGTVLQSFLQRHTGMRVSVSATTRGPRPGEVEGTHYYFMREAEFLALANSGGMLEWASYSGNYYGTPRDMVERELAKGNDVVLEIEVQGAVKVKECCPEAVMVFVLPPTAEELKRRLVGRGTEDEAAVARRLEMARKELAQAACYDYAIINDDVDTAAEQLAAVIAAAKCNTKHMKEFIDEVQKTW